MTVKNITGTILAGCLGGAITLGAYKAFESPVQESTPIVVTETKLGEPAPSMQVNMPNYMAPDAASNVDFTGAASQSVNSVVHITTESVIEYTQYDPFLDFFGGNGNRTYRQPSMSSGSGVIVSEDGYIITNNHVIDKAEKVSVVLNDNKSYTATVVGTDPSTDLALLKVEATGLPYISYGNSEDVQVGEWVLAVGNPFNLTSTVTAGIVSAKGRSINLLEYNPDKDIFPLESFIQTDAAVNPGNSGGALVNTRGELVGINTAIASRTGSYAGYSFAIPVNIVKKVTNDLLEFGTVQRAFIGVSIRDVNQEMAKELDLPSANGVYVSGLTSGGAAADAGVKEGDIITKVGNVSVKNVPELQEQVAKFRPGDKINVTLMRDGNTKVLSMVLRNKDGDTSIVTKDSRTASTASLSVYGASLTTAGSRELDALNLSHGVKIDELTGGKLRSSGIKQGFIITRIDKKDMHSPSDVQRALEDDNDDAVLIEGVYPNGRKAYYGLGL